MESVRWPACTFLWCGTQLHRSRQAEHRCTDLKYKAFAGYGLYYLPLPLPILDVYLKAGLARIDTKVPSADLSDNDTKFSYGGGLQLKFGSYAIRAEYEQFKIESAKPKLLTLGFSKSFL